MFSYLKRKSTSTDDEVCITSLNSHFAGIYSGTEYGRLSSQGYPKESPHQPLAKPMGAKSREQVGHVQPTDALPSWQLTT